MHVYKSQYVNFIDFFVHNNINVAFLIIDFAVNIVEKIVDKSTIIIFKCNYEQCDKSDYWFKNCRQKHFHSKKNLKESHKNLKKSSN